MLIKFKCFKGATKYALEYLHFNNVIPLTFRKEGNTMFPLKKNMLKWFLQEVNILTFR